MVLAICLDIMMLDGSSVFQMETRTRVQPASCQNTHAGGEAVGVFYSLKTEDPGNQSTIYRMYPGTALAQTCGSWSELEGASYPNVEIVNLWVPFSQVCL